MKLGISYMVFDGEELLEFAIKSIKNNVDHVSVTYQDISYFGNPASPELLPTLQKLQSSGLIDELIFFKPDLSLPPKDNELKLRNIGLQASRDAGCSHHISSDVDEFYKSNQLEYAKQVMAKDFNCSVVHLINYYKNPTYLVHPVQNLLVSFIHPVDNEYFVHPKYPFPMESTRRLLKYDKCKYFNKDEFVIHHMSYVRKDIRKKFQNSDNGRCYNKNFYNTFDNYKLGDRIQLLPDYFYRRTIQVENVFGIDF